MPHRFRTPRRVLLLGLVISLAFLGHSRLRPVSKAQEPAKVADRKAMREQIATMHAEIEVLEIEHGIERQELSDYIKEERSIRPLLELAFRSNYAEIRKRIPVSEVSVGGLYVLYTLVNEELNNESLVKNMFEDNTQLLELKAAVLKSLGKEIAEEFDSLGKRPMEEFSEARWRLADRMTEEIRKKATAKARIKTDFYKKEFVRQASELAGKRLDLETLERQYREAR